MNQTKKKEPTLSEEEILRQAAVIRGRRGGQSRSKAKKKAARESLATARAARWPKKEKQP